jgi:hypothetical protein
MRNFKFLISFAVVFSLVYPLSETNAGGDNQPYTVTSVPREMSYQGILRDSAGDPVEDSVYSITFRIFDVASGGTSMWDETLPCTTTAGVFNTMFNNVDLPFDEDYWLELEIDTEILDPRQKMGMVGYAAAADTADYAQQVATVDGATGGTISGDVDIQSNLSVDGDINATGKAAIGSGHTNTGVMAFVAGENSTAGGDWSTVSGGSGDTASGDYSTVGGGLVNIASGEHSAVAGGFDNHAGGDESFVGGGLSNIAGGNRAVVGGGTENIADSGSCVVGGGVYNEATEYAATIGGGRGNKARGEYSVVGGGGGITAADSNAAIGDYSVISGGQANIASAAAAAVGGGNFNTASGEGSVVSGGYAGLASGENATIGGGWHNHASGSVATVGGGQEDTASGFYATVPGGYRNSASGPYSFAAGSSAKANHSGSFVWGDNSPGDFASTGNNQFLIRASGGVGIGTNNPTAALHVNGEAKCEVGGVDFYMVPQGAIIMWSGTLASIPSGWALCDGTSGTPDLRNRFIYGVNSGENPGATGGSATIPDHDHVVDIVQFNSLPTSWVWYGCPTLGGGSRVADYRHSHPVDPPATTSTSDGSASNIPPYFKLAFIMKL